MKYQTFFISIVAVLLLGAGCGSSTNNVSKNVPAMKTDTTVTNSEWSIEFTCPTGWSCGDDEFGVPVVFHTGLAGAEVLFDEISANDLADAVANRKIDLSYYPETRISEEGTLLNGGAYLLLSNSENNLYTSYDIITETNGRYILCRSTLPTESFSENKSVVEKICSSVKSIQ